MEVSSRGVILRYTVIIKRWKMGVRWVTVVTKRWVQIRIVTVRKWECPRMAIRVISVLGSVTPRGRTGCIGMGGTFGMS